MVQSNSLRISCCPLGRLVKKENITEFNRSLFNIRLRALQKMTRVTQNRILLDWDFLCSFSTGVLRPECINNWSMYIVNELSNIMFFQIFPVIRIVIFLIILVWTFLFPWQRHYLQHGICIFLHLQTDSQAHFLHVHGTGKSSRRILVSLMNITIIVFFVSLI